MNPAKIAEKKFTLTRTDVPTAGGGLIKPFQWRDPLPTEKDYEEFPHELGTALYHKEYGELHYLRAPEGLEGKYA